MGPVLPDTLYSIDPNSQIRSIVTHHDKFCIELIIADKEDKIEDISNSVNHKDAIIIAETLLLRDEDDKSKKYKIFSCATDFYTFCVPRWAARFCLVLAPS